MHKQTVNKNWPGGALGNHELLSCLALSHAVVYEQTVKNRYDNVQRRQLHQAISSKRLIFMTVEGHLLVKGLAPGVW